MALAGALGANDAQKATVAAAFKEPTIAETYKDVKAPVADADAGAAIETGINLYKGAATTPVDENTIRNNVLSQFQSEINAGNEIYAEKLREAKVAGISRLGTGRAISARSGTLGSDFGAAQEDKIKTENASIEAGIQAERLAKIAEITGKARTAASEEIALKRKAQTEGLDSYLKFLGAKTERKAASLKAVANSLITQGIKPEEVDPAQLQEIASSYGVTPDELVSSFTSEKKTYDEAAAKAAAAAAKDARVELSAGQKLFTLDPKTGQYVQVASAPSAPTGVKNPITITEAKTLGLPLSIVGQSQDDIVASLSLEAAPQWFREKAQAETPARMSLSPETIAKLWNDYRTKVQTNFEAEESLY